MDGAKIQLSPEELLMVQNTEWLLTKQAIIEKVNLLFGEFAGYWQQLLPQRTSLQQEILIISPKISKGENYQSLPYVMLDYPRYFHRKQTCAIRTFFWWGHFFSVSLQLKGNWKEAFVPHILKHWLPLGDAGFHLAISDEEWRHDFSSEQFRPLKTMDVLEAERIIAQLACCKITAVVPVSEWNDSKQKIEWLYLKLVEVLGADC